MSRSQVRLSLSVLPDTFEADVRGAYIWVVPSTILQFPVRTPSPPWAGYLMICCTCRFITWIQPDLLFVTRLFQDVCEIVDLMENFTDQPVLFSPTQVLSCDYVVHPRSLSLTCLLIRHYLYCIYYCSNVVWHREATGDDSGISASFNYVGNVLLHVTLTNVKCCKSWVTPR